MAAQLCPLQMEATFFATLTSLWNAGNNAATRWGGFLLDKFGVVAVEAVNGRPGLPPGTVGVPVGDVMYDYSNLGTVLWIRFGLSFLPLLLIFLIPN
ncbi:hypothetical protein HK102_006532, partial [Quaeritorhiza haematococci]